MCFSAKITGLCTDIFMKLEYIARSLVKIKSIPDWHLFISRMETEWTEWYAMTSHVIAYQSLELLFGTHTFHFNCFFENFNCVFTQIRCLFRVLISCRGSNIHFICSKQIKSTKIRARLLSGLANQPQYLKVQGN